MKKEKSSTEVDYSKFLNEKRRIKKLFESIILNKSGKDRWFFLFLFNKVRTHYSVRIFFFVFRSHSI